MIKSDEGRIILKGSETTILADLTSAIKAITEKLTEKYDEEFAHEKIDDCVEISRMDSDELHMKVMEKMLEVITVFAKETLEKKDETDDE